MVRSISSFDYAEAFERSTCSLVPEPHASSKRCISARSQVLPVRSTLTTTPSSSTSFSTSACMASTTCARRRPSEDAPYEKPAAPVLTPGAGVTFAAAPQAIAKEAEAEKAERESGVEADEERRASVSWDWADAHAGAPSWSWLLCCSSVAACTCVVDLDKYKTWVTRYKAGARARLLAAKAKALTSASANANAGRTPLAEHVSSVASAPSTPLSRVPFLTAALAAEEEADGATASAVATYAKSAPATPPQSASPSSASSPSDSPAHDTSPSPSPLASQLQSPTDQLVVELIERAPLAPASLTTSADAIDAIEREPNASAGARDRRPLYLWTGDWDSVRAK